MEVKRFIGKIMLLAALLAGTYFLAQWKLSRKYVDPYYAKLTYPAGSMILGVSRAHDGIAPFIIEKELATQTIATPVLNFAFELSQSPYGPVYLNAIKQKVIPEGKNGLFILSVSPGSLTIPLHLPDSVEFVLDQPSMLAQVKRMNSQPNFEYIRKYYGESLYKGFIRYAPYNIRREHKDGWTEVFLKTKNLDIHQYQIDEWTQQTLDAYRNLKYKPSQVRLSSLNEIIKFLKPFGHVFIVRMPIDAEVLELENKFWPRFDEQIENIAQTHSIPFLNYSPQAGHYKTYDGSHMVSASAQEFTATLCHDIASYLDKSNRLK
jgi:hypothetical protein